MVFLNVLCFQHKVAFTTVDHYDWAVAVPLRFPHILFIEIVIFEGQAGIPVLYRVMQAADKFVPVLKFSEIAQTWLKNTYLPLIANIRADLVLKIFRMQQIQLGAGHLSVRANKYAHENDCHDITSEFYWFWLWQHIVLCEFEIIIWLIMIYKSN